MHRQKTIYADWGGGVYEELSKCDKLWRPLATQKTKTTTRLHTTISFLKINNSFAFCFLPLLGRGWKQEEVGKQNILAISVCWLPFLVSSHSLYAPKKMKLIDFVFWKQITVFCFPVSFHRCHLRWRGTTRWYLQSLWRGAKRWALQLRWCGVGHLSTRWERV